MSRAAPGASVGVPSTDGSDSPGWQVAAVRRGLLDPDAVAGELSAPLVEDRRLLCGKRRAADCAASGKSSTENRSDKRTMPCGASDPPDRGNDSAPGASPGAVS